nr:synaptoporin-like [Leptinotarsa decemlineata]
MFSICAFATISGYSGFVKFECPGINSSLLFSYPFDIQWNEKVQNKTNFNICDIHSDGNFSSDSKFFVATGVLAMLYSLVIIFVYTKLDEAYKNNNKLPLYDFFMTVVFGVLWLSSSAAWAHALSGLKSVTSAVTCKSCTPLISSFSTLNISVIFGFLNFFLWATCLWFIYKETSLFQGNQRQTTDGV